MGLLGLSLYLAKGVQDPVSLGYQPLLLLGLMPVEWGLDNRFEFSRLHLSSLGELGGQMRCGIVLPPQRHLQRHRDEDYLQ